MSKNIMIFCGQVSMFIGIIFFPLAWYGRGFFWGLWVWELFTIQGLIFWLVGEATKYHSSASNMGDEKDV